MIATELISKTHISTKKISALSSSARTNMASFALFSPPRIFWPPAPKFSRGIKFVNIFIER